MTIFGNNKNSSSRPHNEQKGPTFSINARQTSWVAVSVLFMGFFVFITGYFMGKKSAVQEFAQNVQQESLADHVYSSLCTICDDANTKITNPAEQKTEEQKVTEVPVAPDNAIQPPAAPVTRTAQENNDQKKYYAQLVGFGTKRAAEQFVTRLGKHGIKVHISSRSSRTAKGKQTTWYQVATQTVSDKSDLQKQIEQIKAIERLHDIHIITC